MRCRICSIVLHSNKANRNDDNLCFNCMYHCDLLPQSIMHYLPHYTFDVPSKSSTTRPRNHKAFYKTKVFKMKCYACRNVESVSKN